MTITQEDRDAASLYWGNDNPPLELVSAMSAHRIAAEQRIVEWLRKQATCGCNGVHGRCNEDDPPLGYAAAIESGEHLPRFVRVPHIGEAS